MHEILCVQTSEQKMLWDIRQLLIEQNELLKKLVPAEQQQQEQEQTGKPCVFCGGSHENKGQALACAKKNKKNGGHA
jgi:hypothetical protein